MTKLLFLAALLFSTAGCESKASAPAPAPITAAPDPGVHNVVTDYVERGQNTMTHASAVAAAENARTNRINQQSQSADQP